MKKEKKLESSSMLIFLLLCHVYVENQRRKFVDVNEIRWKLSVHAFVSHLSMREKNRKVFVAVCDSSPNDLSLGTIVAETFY